LGTDRIEWSVPFDIFYRLTIINNPDPKTTEEMDYDGFFSHLTHASQDEFIRYLNRQSNKQPKNLSINFKDTFYLTGKSDMFIRYFLKKCYDIPKSNKGHFNLSTRRYLNSNKTYKIDDNVKLKRYNRNMVNYDLPNPRNIDIEEWISRINEWLSK